MESEKEREADIRGQRLTVLSSLPEWQEFIAICETEYDAALQHMLKGDEKEVWEARGCVKTLDRILSKVNDRINYGAQCRKKIWEKMNAKKVTI